MIDDADTPPATIDPREVRGPAWPGSHQGSVLAYDAVAGLGLVENDVGTWLFHCTTIADGSRVIEPDTTVQFTVRHGGPGRYEAFDVAPVTP